MGRTRVTENDLLEAMRASLPPEGRPKGKWYTRTELAAKLGVHVRVVETWIRKHPNIERAGGTKVDAGGVNRRVVFYRWSGGKL